MLAPTVVGLNFSSTLCTTLSLIGGIHKPHQHIQYLAKWSMEWQLSQPSKMDQLGMVIGPVNPCKSYQLSALDIPMKLFINNRLQPI